MQRLTRDGSVNTGELSAFVPPGGHGCEGGNAVLRRHQRGSGVSLERGQKVSEEEKRGMVKGQNVIKSVIVSNLLNIVC